MQLRHEKKIEINRADRLLICQRLKYVADLDPHSVNGAYSIRSLYFDTPTDKALREKLDGVLQREKFRIRLYNGSTDFIRLEKKVKLDGMGFKAEAPLTAREAEKIIRGDTEWLRESAEPLLREFYTKLVIQRLRPKTVVEYLREAYICPQGNVRVTFDSGIRTGLCSTDFLSPELVTVPIPGNPTIMEIKWDNYIPEIMLMAVSLTGRTQTAFSKYAKCRAYS